MTAPQLVFVSAAVVVVVAVVMVIAGVAVIAGTGWALVAGGLLLWASVALAGNFGTRDDGRSP